MFYSILIFILIVVGLVLFTFILEQDIRSDRIKKHKKRSGKDRRKKFIGSKNLMRRSGKDRRGNVVKNREANLDNRMIYISS